MIILNINYFISVSIILFVIGALGLVLNRKNIIITIKAKLILLVFINGVFIHEKASDFRIGFIRNLKLIFKFFKLFLNFR